MFSYTVLDTEMQDDFFVSLTLFSVPTHLLSTLSLSLSQTKIKFRVNDETLGFQAYRVHYVWITGVPYGTFARVRVLEGERMCMCE